MVELAKGTRAPTKTCTRCHAEKPATEYYRRRDSRDGLHTWCKPCLLAYHRTRPRGRCIVEGCAKDAEPYGRWCAMHYDRQRLYGDVHRTGRDTPPDSGPVVALRLELERLRTQDVSFSLAWSCALQVALAPLSKRARREWLEALVSTRGAWHSAYTRLPAPELTSLAVLRLADDTAEPWHAHHHGTRL